MNIKYPRRRLPARGVHYPLGEPTIVFVTVCTKGRELWLANESCHALLLGVWSEASAWSVGRYVVMPDHIHLFVSPGETGIELEKWIAYWKSRFTKRHGNAEHRWQKSFWDTRMRSQNSYAEKWEYVRSNPVRHGLVEEPGLWPYQGELAELIW